MKHLHNHLSHASEELMQGKNHKKLGSKKKKKNQKHNNIITEE